MIRRILVLAFVALLVPQDGSAATLGDLRKVGAVRFPTSCTPKAQKTFARGLALLHSFFYDEARNTFEQTASLDPRCAIAEWGIAMTHYHPIWAPPDEAALASGAAAIEKAKSIGGKTDLEKSFIDALAAFYDRNVPAPVTTGQPIGVTACHGEGKQVPDHNARARAYGAAMQALFDRHPENVEVATFYALSLLGTAVPSDKTLANQHRAATVLEPLLEKFRTHPGVLHYYIHACDYPSMAKQALPSARAYAQMAPWVPHSLHMPSHIFTRLGMWSDSVASNLASADAARAYAASHHPDAASFEELHALDYLMFAYLQMGADERAEAVAAHVRTLTRSHPELDLAVAHAQGAIPARFVLERRKWQDAANLEIPAAAYWAKFPFAEAQLHFARGLGAARSGKLEIAKSEVARIGELRKQVQDPKLQIWAAEVEAQQLAVSAFIARAEGSADAEKLLRQAAALEDGAGLHPVSPGSVLPVRELLGDLLIDLSRPTEAVKEYRASLAMRPGRYYALAGIVVAAKAAGDLATAKTAAKDLLALTKSGDGKRPELVIARVLAH